MEIGIVNHVPNFIVFSRGHLHCLKLFTAVRWVHLKNTVIFTTALYSKIPLTWHPWDGTGARRSQSTYADLSS